MKMKKLLISCSTLAFAAIIILCSAFALDDDVFDIEEAAPGEADGYIFKLEDESKSDPAEQSDSVSHIVDDVYLADTVEDIQDIYNASDIEYIEPNYYLSLSAAPNDTYYPQQQGYMDLINAEYYWSNGNTGQGAKIAVIDSGLATNHSDIDYSRVITGYNYIDNNTDTSDSISHGTMVTGIIAATRNNGIGIAGLLNGVSVIPLKITNSADQIPLNYVLKAIDDAVNEYDADVINMSLGTSSVSISLEESINSAVDNNVIVVAAAGNDAQNGNPVYYPAAYPNVVSVGSVGTNGTISADSTHNSGVTVTAPGESIFSTHPNGIAYGSGTSFAAPFVSAMAAAAKSQWGSASTPANFQSLLQSTVTDAGASGYDEYYGYGIINLQTLATALKYDDLLGHWGYSYAIEATDLGLFEGTAYRTFDPDIPMTRAMFATALGRLYEKTTNTTIPDSYPSYADTSGDDGSWYYKYVAWGTENGILEGYGDNLFGPHDPLTREQAAAIMYRYATVFLGDSTPIDTSVLSSYSDSQSISNWAVTPLAWSVTNNIIIGMDPTTLSPQGSALRIQSATIIVRYCDVFNLYS